MVSTLTGSRPHAKTLPVFIMSSGEVEPLERDEATARERLAHQPMADPALLRWLVANNLLPWLD
jgi:hypothetical protein